MNFSGDRTMKLSSQDLNSADWDSSLPALFIFIFLLHFPKTRNISFPCCFLAVQFLDTFSIEYTGLLGDFVHVPDIIWGRNDVEDPGVSLCVRTVGDVSDLIEGECLSLSTGTSPPHLVTFSCLSPDLVSLSLPTCSILRPQPRELPRPPPDTDPCQNQIWSSGCHWAGPGQPGPGEPTPPTSPDSGARQSQQQTKLLSHSVSKYSQSHSQTGSSQPFCLGDKIWYWALPCKYFISEPLSHWATESANIFYY